VLCSVVVVSCRTISQYKTYIWISAIYSRNSAIRSTWLTLCDAYASHCNTLQYAATTCVLSSQLLSSRSILKSHATHKRCATEFQLSQSLYHLGITNFKSSRFHEPYHLHITNFIIYQSCSVSSRHHHLYILSIPRTLSSKYHDRCHLEIFAISPIVSCNAHELYHLNITRSTSFRFHELYDISITNCLIERSRTSRYHQLYFF